MTLATAPSIDIGTVLQDTYEITSQVGQGGMGAVFLARHRRLPGRQVAIKVLHSSFSRNPELFARFRREAEIASQLGHPHIVEVLDFDVLPEGTPFLVMEYLRGESLEARLRRGALPVPEALAIARQMGSALMAAHRAGVIHRDLKPANVFLVPSDVGGLAGDRVKLLDFGISKIADSQTVQTQEAVLIGTPQYMSPEQAQGRNSEVDARTDIFALGCIVYEMLSGVSPFGGSGGSIVQIIYRIVYEPPEPLSSRCPELPPHVIAAVERALAKEPEARFPDVASFISELTGTPLQPLPEAAPAQAVSSQGDDVGFASTLVPAATARSPVPVDAAGFDATRVVPSPEDDVGFAPTLVPSATVRSPVPVDAHSFDDTLVPSSSAPPPVQARSKSLVVAGGIVGVLLLGLAAGWWMRSSPPPPAAPLEPVAVTPPAPTGATPPTPEPPLSPAPESPPQEEAPEPAPIAATSASPAPAPAPVRTSSRQAPRETVPEAVRVDLEAAERELVAGNASEAIRLARRSQRTQVTGASYSLLTRAYCLQRDLSNVNAQWRKVPASERSRVREYCRQYQVEL